MNSAETKRLSVIIPGYNTPGPWWDRCLESVIRNVGENDEVICVDDGSDVVADELVSWCGKDPRVRLVRHEANQGLPASRNTGLELANGRFVTFVDSDDELFPGIYDKCLAGLEETGGDIAMFGVRSDWVDLRLAKEDVPEGGFRGEFAPQDVLSQARSGLLYYAWNKVYRRNFLELKSLMFDCGGVPCEDIVFVLQCVISHAKWHLIDEVGINYYRTDSTLLSRYKATYAKGSRLASETWKEYKKSFPLARDVLGSFGETSDRKLFLGEWDNLWRQQSPFGLNERWRFLVANSSRFEGSTFILFIKTLIGAFTRRMLYKGFIKRMYMKRKFPSVQEY